MRYLSPFQMRSQGQGNFPERGIIPPNSFVVPAIQFQTGLKRCVDNEVESTVAKCHNNEYKTAN
jgi:hypothetical protein